MMPTPHCVSLAAAEALSLDELVAAAGPPIKRMVRASGVSLYCHVGGGRIDPIAGELCDILSAYRPEHVAADPTHARSRRLAPQPRVVLATGQLAPGELHRCAAYSDFYRPHDIEHIACLWLTDVAYGAPGMTGLMISRPRTADGFSDEDRAHLEAALPALAVAVRRCRRAAALREKAKPVTAEPASALERLRTRYQLTAAELKVLRLLALGLKNAEIAARCQLSVETVRTHVQHVLGKLQVESRSRAAVVVWSAESED